METINCSYFLTDKHLNKNSLLNASGNSCSLISINIFLRIIAFQHKRAFFVFRYTAFVAMITKYRSRIPDVSNYSSIKCYVHIWSRNGNILDCYCLTVHLALLTSHNLLFFSLHKTGENNIFGFLSFFFLGKLSKY